MSSPATHEQSVLAIASTHPLLRARNLAASGIPTITLTRMVKSGKLARVIRGVYSLPGSSMSEHRSLAEAALHVSSGVVCLLSALRVHEIGTQAPHEVWLAIEHQAPIPRLDRPTIHIVRMSGAARTEGVEVHVIDGVNVPVFCAAKTVADCFKFRNKIGLEVALEALRDAWAQRKVTIDSLMHFATINRVSNVIRPYVESVVA